jgi:hypothetical protein
MQEELEKDSEFSGFRIQDSEDGRPKFLFLGALGLLTGGDLFTLDSKSGVIHIARPHDCPAHT